MKEKRRTVYPYIPNSAPEVRQEMLAEIGVNCVDELYEDIPANLRLGRLLDLPEPLLSEGQLRRHVAEILSKNATCQDFVSFLGAGCYNHYVPAVCDEINQRSEFLTAYAGEPYDDHGRFQALFEYQSMMAELLDMDVVNVPTYDGLQAAATAVRMAVRITGRRRILVAESISPQVLSKMRDYCGPSIDIDLVTVDRRTGQINLDRLAEALSLETAAVYFENPSYLGTLEARGNEIAALAHKAGALCVVGVDPISLGVIAPPSSYGADIVCGDIQSLGIHMQYGGGHAGFIATHDEERYVMEYPSRLFGIAPTCVPGEYGFGDVAYDRTSFAKREEGTEFVGTASALWGITAGVYLALMGPKGMQELGTGIMQRASYLMTQLNTIIGVKAPLLDAHHFKEFVVSFDETGQTVAQINDALLTQGIFGGVDLTNTFPEHGASALYCVTEKHTKADLDSLVDALRTAVS
ncbi:aminomethyl-transferring glycine dehydrogenase subunit GcvPA [Candidatus Bipolaricaulota bacterium]